MTEIMITNKDLKTSWDKLTDQEKNYAYYISEAANAGAKMIYH